MASRRMWAPWRMEYIRSVKEGGCIFCSYPTAGPSHYRQHLILCARPDAYVILNRYPFAAGHLMVVPRRHVSDLDGLGADEYAALFTLVRDAGRALRAACNADGLNVGINLGASAGAGIAEHLHVHIVPRWRGDLNFMPVVGDVHVMPEALDATYLRLLPFFAPLAATDGGVVTGGGSIGSNSATSESDVPPAPRRRRATRAETRKPRGGSR